MIAKNIRFLSLVSLCSLILFVTVTIALGFLTPGYDHITYTISRLSIERYGFIQQLNFLQLALGLIGSSYVFYKVTQNRELKKVWVAIYTFGASFLLIETMFPTDKIEATNFFEVAISITGIIHLLALALFFILAPLIVYKLSKLMKQDPIFIKYSNMTKIGGYILSLLCFMWTYCLLFGVLTAYLGIFQKIIVFTGFIWLIRLNYAVYRSIR